MLTVFEARTAIEALRAGVPNRTAIRVLADHNPGQDEALRHYLAQCGTVHGDPESRVEGKLIAGGFGAGKSHRLGSVAEIARGENFIVSLLPVSKETPLFDLGRTFAAAIRAAAVPETNEDVMTAMLSRLQSGEALSALEEWVDREVHAERLSPIFAALVYLLPRAHPDERWKIARFFGGSRLTIATVRGWLRQRGADKLFELPRIWEAELAIQRLRFAPRLFAAAGYAGWCVLFDEMELIGRYSLLQRGRSYAELTRWFALDGAYAVPGLAAIAAITDDFTDVMFNQRLDDERVPAKLESRALDDHAARARRSIEWLQRSQISLPVPSRTVLEECLRRIAHLYEQAYGWTPRGVALGPIAASRSMRQYIKSTITTWDIDRLYGERVSISAETIAPDYSENTDLEQAPAAIGDDDG